MVARTAAIARVRGIGIASFLALDRSRINHLDFFELRAIFLFVLFASGGRRYAAKLAVESSFLLDRSHLV